MRPRHLTSEYDLGGANHHDPCLKPTGYSRHAPNTVTRRNDGRFLGTNLLTLKSEREILKWDGISACGCSFESDS